MSAGWRRRVAGPLGVLGGFVAAFVVVAGVSVAGAAPAEARTVGSQPVDDIIAAARAEARPSCGLSANRLAAMVLAPVFGETGAISVPHIAPSPMTLSRWDDQAALYAFGNTSTAYRNAFWHPGVGMWQFDSAGFWNKTAADAVNTATSARSAAKVMADRYCASSGTSDNRMRHAWGPWYACVGQSPGCPTLFRAMFAGDTGAMLPGISRTTAVGRLGGMEARSYQIGNQAPVTCHYINPSRAQGLSSWNARGFGPAPISAPFYVIRDGSTERRYWLRTDSGHDRSIRAHKPVTANARSGMTWQFTTASTGLCDLTARRGDCNAPRVATTPWGPRTAEPFGMVDRVIPGANAVTVAGWAIDPDTNDPIDVHVWVDGSPHRALRADRARPDVAAVVPGYGERHGFRGRVEGLQPGNRRVCVYGINVGPHGKVNPQLGCATVRVSASPQGSLDAVRLAPGGVQVVGWAADVDRPAAATRLQVTVGGTAVGTGVTGTPRPDVPSQLGTNRGFVTTVPATLQAGTPEVCVRAADVDTTGSDTGDWVQLGCRALEVPNRPVVGAIGSLQAGVGVVTLSGWAIEWAADRDAVVGVTVNGVAAGTVAASGTDVDLPARFRAFGGRGGFVVEVSARRGPNRVCITAGGTQVACADTVVTDGDFSDVDPGVWFAEPARWLDTRGITTGFPNAWTFSPATVVTRAQMVTFLWRYMGEPQAGVSCGWRDLPDTSFAAEAACWARAEGIITGVGGDPSRFAPGGGVTRAQAAAMLWRLTGGPTAAPVGGVVTTGFRDVAPAAWFAQPSEWMVSNGITTGIGGGDRFDPGGPVNRAQVAAFLWRLAGNPGAWTTPAPPEALR